ncbi:hypothetical protein HYX17_03855 [Candidatus Woesearchaeota archaeon]|nr:hypothetical protein [Candidatus Woesearchaeota archaeon]
MNNLPKQIIIYFVFMIIISVPLFYLFAYIHELGHKSQFTSEDINSKIKINYLKWPYGLTYPAASEDCDKFNGLSQESKAKIYYGGIKYNILSLFLIIISLTLAIAFLIARPESANKKWLIIIFLLILVALIVLIQPLAKNSNPLIVNGDIWKLVNNFTFNCENMFKSL